MSDGQTNDLNCARPSCRPGRSHKCARPSRFKLALAAGLLLISGCVNWSKDVSEYRKVLGGPTTRPLFMAQAPLTLTHALDIANADNESIASSGESYIQALADKMRAAGVFLPTLSLAPSYRLVNSSGSSGSNVVIPSGTSDGSATIINTGQSGGTTDSTSVSANASWNGSLAEISDSIAAARTVEQRAQLLLDERETILLQVAQAYYDVLRFEKQIEVLNNSIDLRQEQVRDQEARVKIGNARTLDLAQTQSDLAATRVSLAQAHTDSLNARSALARLMGVDVIEGSLTDEFTAPALSEDADAWQHRALAQRQDLLAAARAVESARQNVESAIRAYFPSIGIDFNYYLFNEPSSSQNWTAGLSANVPIFTALQIESNVRAAWSRYRQAGLAQSLARRTALDDVNRGYQNLVGSREKLEYLKVQTEAAQRAVDLSERAYRLGSDTNLNRLIQQNNLLTAQLNLIDEQFNEKTFYLALLRAVGELSGVITK